MELTKIANTVGMVIRAIGVAAIISIAVKEFRINQED